MTHFKLDLLYAGLSIDGGRMSEYYVVSYTGVGYRFGDLERETDPIPFLEKALERAKSMAQVGLTNIQLWKIQKEEVEIPCLEK